VVAVSSFVYGARSMVNPSQCTTPWTAAAMTAMVSPSRQQQVSTLSPRSPTTYKKSGVDKGMAFMQSMFKAYVKSQKKTGKSKKCKKRA
jgi:hypothetical protein